MKHQNVPKRGSARAPGGEGSLRLSSLALRRTWVLIGWAGTIVAAAWGMNYLEQYVQAARPNVPCRLEWIDLPNWLSAPDNAWVLYQIGQAIDARPDDDVYDPELCRRVGQSLAGSPWVERVERVTKQPDGTVRVQAAFREPLAFVESRGRAYLVDGTGVRLPLEYSPDFLGPSDLFVVVGVSGPIPDIGQAWSGKDPQQPAVDLAAGLKLVRFLHDAAVQGRLPFRAWLRKIDVANFDGRDNKFDGRLRIRTIHPNCYIDWGLPPGEEATVDTASASRKLDLLNALYAEQGQLPARILVVRWKEGVDCREPKKH